MDGVLEAVAEEALRLAVAAGVPLVVTVGLLLAAALVLVVAKRVRLPHPDPPPLPDPDAKWNDDPTQGAVVVPGPPGGTDDQNQSG